jgi:hypothetical protein
MSFGARKLRVQLPCGADGSVIAEEAGGDGCGDWTTICQIFTCDWGTDCVNVFWTTPLQGPTVLCQWSSPCGTGYGTCPYNSCPNATCTFPSPCQYGTCVGRGPLHSIVVGPGTIREQALVVDADQLPRLREHLEAQLKEIEKAERAVEERRSQSEE